MPPLRPDVKGGLFGLIMGGLALLGGGYMSGAIKIGEAYQDKGAAGAADEFNRQMQTTYERGYAAGVAFQGSRPCAGGSLPPPVAPADPYAYGKRR